MKSQHQYESIRDEILSILENKNLTISEKSDRLNIAELIQDTDIYQAELIAQNQELLEKEDELINSRIEFESLFNLAPIAYLELDKNYNILKYNNFASELFYELNLKMYKDKSFTLLLENGEILNFITLENQVKSDGYSYGLFKFRSKTILFGRVDIKKHNNNFFVSIVDMTNEKKQEAMILAQAKKSAMGEMVSMITHQWKQPISVISILSTTMDLELESDMFDKEKFIHHTQQIKEQIDYMGETIDDFKEYFSDDKTRLTQNVKDCIERAKRFTASALETNNINLHINFIDDGDYNILSFRHDVCQVLMNIINNAKDEFLKKKLTYERNITIDIFHEDDDIVLSIKNNAGLIPDEIMELIFHPNFTTKKNLGGSGIGLYIVEKIVKEHLCGSITVQNIEYENSVVFTIRVPLIKKGA